MYYPVTPDVTAVFGEIEQALVNAVRSDLPLPAHPIDRDCGVKDPHWARRIHAHTDRWLKTVLQRHCFDGFAAAVSPDRPPLDVARRLLHALARATRGQMTAETLIVQAASGPNEYGDYYWEVKVRKGAEGGMAEAVESGLLAPFCSAYLADDAGKATAASYAPSSTVRAVGRQAGDVLGDLLLFVARTCRAESLQQLQRAVADGADDETAVRSSGAAWGWIGDATGVHMAIARMMIRRAEFIASVRGGIALEPFRDFVESYLTDFAGQACVEASLVAFPPAAERVTQGMKVLAPPAGSVGFYNEPSTRGILAALPPHVVAAWLDAVYAHEMRALRLLLIDQHDTLQRAQWCLRRAFAHSVSTQLSGTLGDAVHAALTSLDLAQPLQWDAHSDAFKKISHIRTLSSTIEVFEPAVAAAARDRVATSLSDLMHTGAAAALRSVATATHANSMGAAVCLIEAIAPVLQAQCRIATAAAWVAATSGMTSTIGMLLEQPLQLCYAAAPGHPAAPPRSIRVAELIAVFVDGYLVGAPIALACRQQADAALYPARALDVAVVLVATLRDRDRFELHHRRLMSKRLLNAAAATEADERAFLALVAPHLSGGLPQRFSAMVEDVAQSRVLSQAFNERLVAGGMHRRSEDGSSDAHAGCTCIPAMYQVLRRSAWPEFPRALPCRLPGALEKHVEAFRRYYMSRAGHTLRKLTLVPMLCTGVAEVTYPGSGSDNTGRSAPNRQRDLVGPLLQLLVICAVDALAGRAHPATTADVNATTDLPLEFVAAVTSALSRQRAPGGSVLRRVDGGVELDPDFRPPTRRVRLPAVATDAAAAAADKVADELGAARRVVTEAAIVRVMKARRVLSLQQLYEIVATQLSRQFVPELRYVKACVERLIELEYLQRGEKSGEFTYVA